jgi:hypothetical protein
MEIPEEREFSMVLPERQPAQGGCALPEVNVLTESFLRSAAGERHGKPNKLGVPADSARIGLA